MRVLERDIMERACLEKLEAVRAAEHSVQIQLRRLSQLRDI